MIETETISCPACQVEQETSVYQTINAMEDAELVQKLMQGHPQGYLGERYPL
jgi:hypothetical protein